MAASLLAQPPREKIGAVQAMINFSQARRHRGLIRSAAVLQCAQARGA
jgi:hypothetical protein